MRGMGMILYQCMVFNAILVAITASATIRSYHKHGVDVEHTSSNNDSRRLNSNNGMISRRADDESESDSPSSSNTTGNRKGVTDLLPLVPFDVRIGVTTDNGIGIFEVSTIVTSWLNDALIEQLTISGYTYENNYAIFQGVVLVKRSEERHLRSFVERQQQQEKDDTNTTFNINDIIGENGENAGDSFVARLKGGALFAKETKDTLSVPENDLLVMQQMIVTSENYTSILLETLQASNADGLGDSVVDVRSELVASTDTPTTDTPPTNNDTDGGASAINDNTPSSSSSGDGSSSQSRDQLEIVIIAAIAVAVLAFLFLLAAIYWAYQYDKKNREAFLVENTNNNNNTPGGGSDRKKKKKSKKNIDITDSETSSPKTSMPSPDGGAGVTLQPPKTIYQSRYPAYPTVVGGSVIGNPVYPESVISDSIIDDQKSIRSYGDDIEMDVTTNTGVGDNHYPNNASAIQSPSIAPSNATLDIDEVSASLSQYYRSGMGKIGVPTTTSNINSKSATENVVTSNSRYHSHHPLNDAASVSSMESYGYSLDGTIPTIMSPRTGGEFTGGSSNNNNNPYMSHLERIGGLPVEPDLRHIEDLTMDDINTTMYNDNDDFGSQQSGTIGGENDLCTVDGSMLPLD